MWHDRPWRRRVAVLSACRRPLLAGATAAPASLPRLGPPRRLIRRVGPTASLGDARCRAIGDRRAARRAAPEADDACAVPIWSENPGIGDPPPPPPRTASARATRSSRRGWSAGRGVAHQFPNRGSGIRAGVPEARSQERPRTVASGPTTAVSPSRRTSRCHCVVPAAGPAAATGEHSRR